MSIASLNPELQLYVNDTNPNTNYFATKRLQIGRFTNSASAPINLTKGLNRSWIRFDLSSIPSGSTINSAKIQMVSFFQQGGVPVSNSGFNVDLAPSTDITWTNALTWNTAPDGTVGAVSASSAGNPDWTGSPVPFELTGLATDITTALPTGKITYRLKTDAEATNDYYVTCENSDFPAPKPLLVIDYTPLITNTNFLIMF